MSSRTTSFISIVLIVARPQRDIRAVTHEQILWVWNALLAEPGLELGGLGLARHALRKYKLEIFGYRGPDPNSLGHSRLFSAEYFRDIRGSVSSKGSQEHEENISVSPARSPRIVSLAPCRHFLHHMYNRGVTFIDFFEPNVNLGAGVPFFFLEGLFKIGPLGFDRGVFFTRGEFNFFGLAM